MACDQPWQDLFRQLLVRVEAKVRARAHTHSTLQAIAPPNPPPPPTHTHIQFGAHVYYSSVLLPPDLT